MITKKCFSRLSDENQVPSNQFWPATHPQLPHLPPLTTPKVQVMPAHQIPLHEEVSESFQPNYEADKDKFQCLYLLVETAVAVRQREKEQVQRC